MKLRLLTAGLMLVTAAAISGAGVTTVKDGSNQGVYVGGDKGPQAALYTQPDGHVAALGFTCDPKAPKVGSEFAIVALKGGVHFQVIDAAGTVHFIPVTALVGLDPKAPKWSPAK